MAVHPCASELFRLCAPVVHEFVAGDVAKLSHGAALSGECCRREKDLISMRVVVVVVLHMVSDSCCGSAAPRAHMVRAVVAAAFS